jgi:hypothetical protein
MPTEIWVALIGFGGVSLTVLITVWIYRATSRQAEKAASRSAVAEANKTGIAGLRELAEQNRKDRAEWRAERVQMIKERDEDRQRLDRLEHEMILMRAEREQDRILIERLKTEHTWHVGYIRVLIDFIKRLGRTPPAPDNPIALQSE